MNGLKFLAFLVGQYLVFGVVAVLRGEVLVAPEAKAVLFLAQLENVTEEHISTKN